MRIFRHYIMITLFFMTAVGGKLYAQKTPLEMNDRLVTITDSLQEKANLWGTELPQALKNNDYTRLKGYRTALAGYITRETARLKVLKDVKNSKSLRELFIEFMALEKSVVERGMVPFEKFTATVTEAEINTAVENFKTITKEEDVFLEKIAAAQEAYAKANNFTIESGEEASGN